MVRRRRTSVSTAEEACVRAERSAPRRKIARINAYYVDLANPKANTKNHGFTPEEREGFSSILKAGFVDSFREFEKEGGHYTWWSPMAGARARNVGWRIDYFCVTKNLVPRLKRAEILDGQAGSDHCPVVLELE